MKALGELLTYQERHSAEEALQATQDFAWNRWVLIVVGSAAAVVAGLLGWLVTLSITRPLAQAVGLWRWVFVIPDLARIHADPAATEAARQAAAQAFDILNRYGGVAIGEHLGQLLTALFVLILARLQWAEGRRVTAGTGFATALAIAFGTTEGLAIALGGDGGAFALGTIAGFLGLTLWLVLTGLGLLRGARALPLPA